METNLHFSDYINDRIPFCQKNSIKFVKNVLLVIVNELHPKLNWLLCDVTPDK